MIFVPKAGMSLTVTLPGEQMRAAVTKVLDRNTVIVKLGQPMTRTHSFRKDDLVACRRMLSELGEFWEAIENMQPLPETPPKISQKPAKPAKNALDSTISTKPARSNVTKLVVNNERAPKPG